MANGFGGMGLGQPGVRETKVVNEISEEKIPLAQAISIWFATLLLLFFAYLCLKFLIVSRGDWSLLIGIISIPLFPAVAIFSERKIVKRFFPRVYVDFMNVSSRVLQGDNVGIFILYCLILIIPILLVLGFYISVIVVQMTNILQNEAHTVFIFCAMVALVVAYYPYYTFNKRQLVDSLRDSDSKYATRSLEISNENYWKRQALTDAIMALPSANPEPKEEYFPRPMLVRAPKKSLPAPTSADERYKKAVIEFLTGIESGWWGTSEVSWRNKTMPETGHNVRTIGKKVRDDLIEAGYARWKNPDNTSAGWDLLFAIEEIEAEAFNGSSTIRPAGEGSGEFTDDDNLEDDGD